MKFGKVEFNPDVSGLKDTSKEDFEAVYSKLMSKEQLAQAWKWVQTKLKSVRKNTTVSNSAKSKPAKRGKSVSNSGKHSASKAADKKA